LSDGAIVIRVNCDLFLANYLNVISYFLPSNFDLNDFWCGDVHCDFHLCDDDLCECCLNVNAFILLYIFMSYDGFTLFNGDGLFIHDVMNVCSLVHDANGDVLCHVNACFNDLSHGNADGFHLNDGASNDASASPNEPFLENDEILHESDHYEICAFLPFLKFLSFILSHKASKSKDSSQEPIQKHSMKIENFSTIVIAPHF